MEHRCRDEGDNPSCLGVADERYTMRFDDIGEPPIYWCAHCGPGAHSINEALEERLKTDPNFAGELRAAINETKN